MSSIKIEGQAEAVPFSNGTLTLNIPIKIKRRGGCKKITLPNGEEGMANSPKKPTAMQLALARGYRWLAMLESGEVKTMRELAAREGVDNSYVSRMVNLTLLPPWIIAAILDDSLPEDVLLFDMAVDPPALWDEQRSRLAYP
ncbi:hypothetical protein [Ferriphaselus sp. R-1]|uniref:hypothetical protein n=1 Tax=Ferriphaselus sp. R-1 TaxID=1485544 RepID=UPI000554233B|nr:hypothetical protein [Ferriphaselus sp. R-1]